MRIVVKLLLLVTLLLSSPAFAQGGVGGAVSSTPPASASGGAAAQAPQASPAASAKFIGDSYSLEFAALVEQNKIMKQYHDSLLDTVYWALSLIGVVAVLLVGASGLVNFKLYEGDKARLEESFRAKIGEMKAQLDAQLADARSESAKSTQSLMETYAGRLSDDARALRSDLTTAIASLNGRFDSIDARQAESVKVADDLKRSVDSVKADVHSVERHVWELKDIPSNIILAHAQVLRAAIRAGEKWRIKMTLDRLKEDLSTYFVASNKPLPKFVLGLVADQLKSCEAQLPAEVAAIRPLLEKIKAEE